MLEAQDKDERRDNSWYNAQYRQDQIDADIERASILLQEHCQRWQKQWKERQ